MARLDPVQAFMGCGSDMGCLSTSLFCGIQLMELQTKERLHKPGIREQEDCMIYGSSIEIPDHLFLAAATVKPVLLLCFSG